MNMNMTKFDPARSRKLKYGAMSVIMTTVVIAAVVIVNVIFSALAYNKNWYIDMTKDKLYGLSDAGREMLDTIDHDIQIHFCAPYDELEANFYQKLVFELVKEMAASYDNITYDYIDIISNPTAINKYKSTTATSIKTTNIIVESGTEFRVFTLEAMFVFNESQVVWAFNGEKKLITAMMQITQAETPIAYYTYTHGEAISENVYLLELFYDAGYDVRPIDLTKEDVDPTADVILICNPIYDFEGISEDTKGRKSEIEKIDDFLDGFNNVMVFCDPETPVLPELFEFLYEWGIEFDQSQLKDPTNAIDTESLAIVGNYAIDESLGASLVKPITSLGTPPKTIVKEARPINLVWDAKDSRITSTVLYTSDTADKYSLETGEMVDEGQFPLVVLSRESRYIENVPHYSYVFAVGSKYFASDDYLGKSTYGNADILHNMMLTMGKEQVPIDLDFKLFEDESLDITTQEAANWTIFLTAFIPAVVLIAGIVIWIRRKHA
ncbi:MAG: hypothetical protein E7632_04525 [Ruminococcaceae bacterium]|nr:hypothetical protein [Oscillospiraceae bacterium]